MKLMHKLVLGALLLTSLIWVAGFYTVGASRRALQDAIEGSSAVLAAKTIDEVDRAIHAAIDDWLVYSVSPLVQRTIKASNQEFEKLQDIQAYIDRRDDQWCSAPKETLTAFMEGLLTNELSEALRTKLGAFERDEGYRPYGEVFVTNRYGANVAQTGKTTDYRQDDEEWWRRAREDGTYVADVEYDRSAGAQSVDVCVRVDDENGNFIGVIKAVFAIEGISALLRSRTADWELGAAKQSRPVLRLLTADKRIIFPADSSSPVLADGSRFLEAHEHSGDRGVHTHRRHDEELGDVLACYVFSRGYDEFKSLGWILIVEHRAEDILAPVAALRRKILLISVGVTAAGLVLGVGLSVSMARRISRLKNAAVRVGQGDLNASLDVRGADEIGQLGRCFNEMTRRLSETLVSKSALEFEIAERKRVEEVIRASQDFLQAVIDAIPAAMMVIDLDYRVILANETARQAGGGRDPVAGGMTCHELSHHRDTPCEGLADPCPLKQVAATEASVTVTHTHYDADGNEGFVEVSAAPIFDGAGQVVRIIQSCRDITDQMRAGQELQQRMDELEQFNRLAVGREQRMIELKREVNELARKAGAAPPYDLGFVESGTGGTGSEA